MSGTTGTGIVTFEYQSWAFLFPELAPTVTQGMAQAYFARACLMVDNTACSRISDLPTRTMILNLTVAHIAALNAPKPNGEPASPLVGRISSASEGSVSVSTEYSAPGSAAWWAQSRYGAEAYQAMAPYRTFRYAPNPTVAVQPWGIGFGGYRGF